MATQTNGLQPRAVAFCPKDRVPHISPLRCGFTPPEPAHSLDIHPHRPTMLAMQTRALCLVLLLAATAIPAQQPAKSPAAPAVSAPNGQTSANAGSAPVRAYAFEVISIRRNKTPTTLEVLAHDGPTADGYRNHSPLLLPLLTAYVPQAGGAAFYTFDQIKGIPDWLVGERYDVDARIADQDRAKWKKPAAQKAMLASMLQSLLTDRCKLAVHREMKETQVTSLMVAKGGPKFKETD